MVASLAVMWSDPRHFAVRFQVEESKGMGARGVGALELRSPVVVALSCQQAESDGSVLVGILNENRLIFSAVMKNCLAINQLRH